MKTDREGFTTMRFGGVAFFIALFIVSLRPTSARAYPFPEEHITLAGSFNNWSANDGDFRLSPDGDKYRLLRFWPCGVYEFKFVFDGNWARHLGADSDGQLVQPGENISLRIDRSATYSLWFDVKQAKWGTKRQSPERPHAVIRVVGAKSGMWEVILDGRLSEGGHKRQIQNYNWMVEHADGVRGEIQLTSIDDRSTSLQRLAIANRGRYRISLRIDDGEEKAEAQETVALGDGWKITWNDSNPRRPIVSSNMMPLDGGAWGADYGSDAAGYISPRVTPLTQHENPEKAISDKYRYESKKPFLVRLDPVSHSLSFQTSGFHSFVFEENARQLPEGTFVERVDLVGDFNGWQAGATPMLEKWATKRQFTRILELPDGVYHYKLLVNGTHWLEDQTADSRLRVADGKGGFNSGVRVGDDAATFGKSKPDHIAVGAVKHEPSLSQYYTPITDHAVHMVVRTLANDVDGVELLRDRGNLPLPLIRSRSENGFDYWAGQVLTESDHLRYAFRLHDGSSSCYLGSDGISEDANEPQDKFTQTIHMDFKTPDWAKTAVWYQIFPERFRNGDTSNDPPMTVPWTHEWYKSYQGKGPSGRKIKEKGTFYEYIYDRRYGGDLQGVQEKLPYLRELGINAIYFNPIFLAESLHKYDASDYRHIDDFFGVKGSLKKIKDETTDSKTWQWSETDRIFLEFLKEAHRQGFKVILDGVFNHTGRDFWAFRDILKNREKSEFVDWFDIVSWKPFHYRAWDKPDGELPRLKHDDALGLSKPVRDHLFAVTRRWMDPNGDGDPSDGIDGWRLDVAGDINANFWSDWRKLVKSVNPDAFIVAELWQESKSWLDGNTFDAVMNYPFAVRCQRFFVNQKKAIVPTTFGKQLEEILGWYKPQVNYVLQNLFGSHDTDRVTSMFMNPDLEYDQANRIQDNGPKYDPKLPTPECYQKFKQMVAFQMTFLGAPMIYYGDEVGMYGADDPSCRKPMLWEDLMPYADPDEKIKPDVFEHHRRWIAIRNTYPALQLGSFDILLADDEHGVFAFVRTLGRDSVVVVLNNSDKPYELNIPVPWKESDSIVRLDDPKECEIISPAKSDLKSRATVQPNERAKSKYQIDNGRLNGIVLDPRTAAAFTKAASPD